MHSLYNIYIMHKKAYAILDKIYYKQHDYHGHETDTM